MGKPLICLSCGFPIGFLIHKYENINFEEIEKEIDLKLKTCCRMKMLSFLR